MEKLLSRSTLEGTCEALSIGSPNHCGLVETVLRRKPVKCGIVAARGQSTDDQYDAEMPIQDAESILAALVRIEVRDHSAKFQSQPIKLLVAVWRSMVSKLRRCSV